MADPEVRIAAGSFDVSDDVTMAGGDNNGEVDEAAAAEAALQAIDPEEEETIDLTPAYLE